MKSVQLFFSVIILLLFSFGNLRAQTLINGSFEITTAPVGCNYNLSNAVFNSYFADVEAYGGGNECDIIMDGCYVTDLPDGLRSISLAHVPEDEVSIPIAAPLVMGNTYTLSFYALSETTFAGPGNLMVGASTSATSFGIPIQTVSPTVMAWGNHTFTFVAPNNSTHITVKNAPGGAFWNHVDHFEFVVPLDSLEIDQTNVTCFGACDGTATVVEGVDGPYTFVWDALAGGGTTGTVTGLCPGSYSVEVTSASGLVEVLDVTITEPAELVGSIISLTDVTCFGLSDGTVSIDAIGGTGTYTFDIGAGPAATGDFTGLAAGSYTVTILDDSACVETISFVILEPSELLLTEDYSTNLTCFGAGDGEINVLASGGTPGYLYAIDGGVFGAGALFSSLDAGVHTIAVQDNNACETTLTIALTEPVAVTASQSALGETCLGDCTGSIELGGLTGIAPFTYSIDACATSSPSGTFAALCAGTYPICVTDDNGCVYTSSINVAAGATTFDPSLNPIASLCLNDAPVAITGVDLGVLTGPGVVGSTFNPALAGVGTHTITNTILIGCGGVGTINVTVLPLPVVSFTSDVNSGCEPVSVVFNSTGEVGLSCLWQFGDGTSSVSCGSAAHTYSNPGNYDVTYQITNANGCTNSAVYTDYISVYALPEADFTWAPTTITTLDTEVEFRNLSSGESAWDWQFSNLGTSSLENPAFTFPEISGNYEVTLTVFTNEGCSDIIKKILFIDQEVLFFIPNVITPDGDTYNEVFTPFINGIDIYDYHMTIFNRWGELVFESYDSSRGWNGTFGGEIVQDGVYIWHIEAGALHTDKRLEFDGHVTVIK